MHVRSAAAIRPAVALQFALLASLVSNLVRIPLFDAGEANAPILVNDIAIALMLATGAAVIARNRSLRLDRVAISALVFAAIGASSAIAGVFKYDLTAFELAISLAYLARWLFYFAIYLVVINLVRRRDVMPVWRSLEWMLIIFAAFGIFQSIFLPGFAQMVYPDSRIGYDWDYQGHRLVSTVLEPNIAAAMLLLGVTVQLGQLASGAPIPRWKPTLLFVAMVMTLSRSGGLGFIVAAFVILAARGLSARLMRFAGAMAFLGILALPRLIPFMLEYDKLSLGGSAAGRLVNLAQALDAFRDSPWFGIGFNTFGFFMDRYHSIDRISLAHQSSDGGLLFAAVMTGIVGLSVYLFMMATVVRRCRGIWRNPRFTAEERGLAIGVAASLFGLCIHSTFANSLFTTAVLLPLWVLWGLTFSIARTDDALDELPSAEPPQARVVAYG
jgi:hypothetical protein